MDDIYKEKVVKAREEQLKQTVNNPTNDSETEQTLDIPKDIEKKQIINQDQEPLINIKESSEDSKFKKRLLLDVDENTEISVDTNEILEHQSENNMMALAPLGPIGSKKPLAPLKKLSPLGSIDKPPLGSIDQKPLGLIGKKKSLEKTPLYNDNLKQSPKSDDNVPEGIDKSPKRGLKGLKMGMGKTFLKSDSLESQERGEDSDQTSVRSGASGGSGRGILRPDNLLRQAMMKREEKRIMFDLGSNVQFASEVK